MSIEYKQGSRVVMVSSSTRVPSGTLGTVHSVECDDYVYVTWDEDIGGHTGNGGVPLATLLVIFAISF